MRYEPTIRVGIVLNDDRAQKIVVRATRSASAEPASNDPALSVRSPIMRFIYHGAEIVLCSASAQPHLSAAWRVAPAEPTPTTPDAGLTVERVPVGRGFHWRKQLDQTLPGSLEVRAGADGLVVVNHVALEDYLACVVTSEMSGDCPPEFLKAQAIVARSWLLAFTERKHPDEPFDRCNDDCCQRYHGTHGLTPAARDAVDSTYGQALVTPTGDPVDANYSKCCGGVTELPVHVWNVAKECVKAQVDAPAASAARAFLPVTEDNVDPYVTGGWLASTDVYCSPNVVSPDALRQFLGRADDPGEYFRWRKTIPRDALEQRLRALMPDAANLVQLHDVQPVARGVSGRISRLRLAFEDGGGGSRVTDIAGELAIRMLLDPDTLYSSAFAITPQRDATGAVQAFHLRGAGWGHGVGMCQIGALGMALKGSTHAQILCHYFPAARTATLYEPSAGPANT